MRKLLLGLLAGLLLTAGAAPAAQQKSVKVLIITGDHGHDWRSTTPFLKDLLTKAGHQVEVTETIADLGGPGSTPKPVEDVAKEIIEKDAANDKGRPGKDDVGEKPRRTALLVAAGVGTVIVLAVGGIVMFSGSVSSSVRVMVFESVLLVVSTSGDSPVTVIVSASVASLSS